MIVKEAVSEKSTKTGTTGATMIDRGSTAEKETGTETETGERTGMFMEGCRMASLGEGIQW